ncbi:hypothetical protein M406DRAFT_254187 [Cryphonectria parasitica EP155]|uniref:Xylanolytic transcriptional activator regulatory domain-containing protein n=1 Tax=Cryphonectria parasitica (strain ATCC 38755 / EP155) TaxID=660469 RepID=A0A9P4Y628_CRYP1|nr:uncharacterized protein M406DRAFT_254187 [Cryphonectria parasitica EP155]KAF3767228.1 hypothetical protein M406DRAFT_254187 [Cryphonectria parasitica EP155]
MLAKSRYLGSSHWIHGITLFPRTNTLMVLLDSLKADKTSVTYQAIATSKSIGRTIKAGRVPRLMTMEFGKHVPSKELADELLESYFRTFESVYRILHVPSFRLEYGRYWQNPQLAREAFVIQLQLCMAMGAVVWDEKYSLRKLSVRWVYEARLWLMQPSEKSRINLPGLQVWCLVHLARDVCGVGSDLVWTSAGTMMRMALYTGLHRDPDHLPKMSLLAAETRRRLWATILEILVQSSMESGGPPLISTADFDCKPPGNYNDEDLLGDNVAAAPPSPQPATTFTDTSVQIALLNSIKIRLRIAAYLNEFRSVPTYDKTLALNADLTAASRSLDALLRVHQAQSSGLSSFQLAVTEHIVQRYFLALHLPWLGLAKDNPRYFFSRKVCVEIALRNQKEVKAHGGLGSDFNGSVPDEFGKLLICATGGYRYIGTQCLLALTLELVWNLEEQRRALRSLTGGSSTTEPTSTPGMGFGILGSPAANSGEMLEVLRDSTNWMRMRIKAGEVNVKGYMFGLAMLAEADGLFQGVSDEQLKSIVRTACESAAAETLSMLKEMHAAEGAQSGVGATGSAASGMGSVACPRYMGMDGTQVPMPDPEDSQGFEAMDTGSSGTITDWDWDVVSIYCPLLT